MTRSPVHRGVPALLTAAVLGLAGCGGDGAERESWFAGSASSSAPTVEELRAGMLWRGKYTNDIEVWEPCGPAGELIQVDRYQRTESFSLATHSPVDYGPGIRETNPFYLSAGMDLRVGGTVGLTIISTSETTLPGREGDPYVYQYWQLQYDDGHLTGSMFQDGTPNVGEQFINDLRSTSPCQPGGLTFSFRYPLKRGATLEAALQDDRASMVVVAQSIDGTRRWRAVATATRAQ
jgi:hypothetical protein